MQLKIGRVVLDTDKAVQVFEQNTGAFGESHGFQEILYRQNTRFFFVVQGGEHSPYAFSTPKIVPLSEEDAKAWFSRVAGDAFSEEAFYGKKKRSVKKVASPSVEKEAAPKKASAKKAVATNEKPAPKKRVSKKTKA